MTDHRTPPGATQRTSRRSSVAALALVAVVVWAVVVAGCASAPDGTHTGSDTGGADHDQGLRFAACMRDHGISGFPDPDASGELTIDGIANGSSLDPSTAEFTQALEACEDLQPAGFMGQEDLSPQQLDARLEFAQCIRDNGVPDFADPAPDAPLVDTNRIPSAATDAGMSALNAAMQTCGDVAAKALGDE